MKSWLIFLFFFLHSLLSAQSLGEALTFHQEGRLLLEQESVCIFDKLSALNLFSKSQDLLQTSEPENQELALQNDSLIQQLLPLFVIDNPDSLLETTRFFPDSIFQRSNSYTAEFKNLINDYLALKSRVVRRSFFNFAHLNKYEKEGRITIDSYWPLEVIELETWLVKQEKETNRFVKSAQSELLQSRLNLKKNALEQEEKTSNHEQNVANLLNNITEIQAEKEALIENSKKWKYTGFGIFFTLLFLGYWLWNKTRKLLESKHQSLLEEKKRSEDILSNILPSEVVRQLKQNKIPKAQSYHSIGVLFTDFQNFSQISKNLPPEELVRELDYCFTNFDFIIEKHHLHKIKTIGDAYMCIGGLYTKG
ncbi:MAG: adenylate/guanylate cyclase domain-containing protein, partial [Bacteroidota bacterium]